MSKNDMILSHVRELKIRKARKCFFTFAKLIYPTFHFGWFQAVLCEEFQYFYEQIVAKEQPRLMFFAPPRHGKSTLTHAFHAWCFGQNPDTQVIGASYGATLAQKNNRLVQRIMENHIYNEIFPETQLPGKNIRIVSGQYLRNSDEFEIVGHSGSYRAAGVGGSITGTGADIGTIDDPVKGMKDAASTTVQETQRDWYLGDFYTRLSPVSGVLIFLTRWNTRDLAGYLVDEQEKGGDKFRVLSFSAIAETDEYQYRFDGYNEYGPEARTDCKCVLLRKAGGALHPERWDLERLGKIMKAGEARGVWDALYQQRPTIKGGDIFKERWFPRYDKFSDLWSYKRTENELIATAIHGDTAQKTKEQHDYSVFEWWGIGKNDIYLLDVHRGKWDAPDLLREAVWFWNRCKKKYKFRPACRGMYIEDKSSGTGLIQTLKKKSRIPVIAIPRTTDKIERAYDAAPHIESGNVWLPEEAPWLGEFIAEVTAFNKNMSHANDDQTDPMMDAIEKWLGGSISIYDLIDQMG